MNIAEQIAIFRAKGFTDDQSDVIALMRLAAAVLFEAFPESFIMFGGATLLLFHESPRHSGDLDLLARTDERPSFQAVSTALGTGLNSAAEALKQSRQQSLGQSGRRSAVVSRRPQPFWFGIGEPS